MTADPNNASSKMTGARQTMMSWARVIQTFDAVPGFYKYSYRALGVDTGAIPYTVFAPAQRGPRGRKLVERLLCEIGGTLYVLERAGTRVVTSAFAYADICSLEVGNILLYSWFSISGNPGNTELPTGDKESPWGNTELPTGDEALPMDAETAPGALRGSLTLTVEFNEATLRHFESFFRKMRTFPLDAEGAGPDLKTEQAKFDVLLAANYKFMSFARESLAPGERVLQFVYQPSSRQRVTTLLGRNIYRTLSLAHLMILTDQEIILIGDVEGITRRQRSKYGGVRRYLPLRKIRAAGLEEQADGFWRFSLRVEGDIRVERLFDAGHAKEVEALKMELEKRIGYKR